MDEWSLIGGGIVAALSGLLVYLRRSRLRIRLQASFRSPPRPGSEPSKSEEPPPYPRRRYDAADDDG